MVERYADDLRAAGAKAYFDLGGTTTPMSVYQDSGEASAHTYPVVADANGRWPDVFIPYIVSYNVRVTSADDVQLTYSLEIPNPDPIELSVTIPAEEKIQTGMIHAEMVNTVKSGYVRLNGRTVGNASSSGTERANADTSALFTYLWNNLTDTIAPVSSGRGGSAAADFAANKTITLVNWQGAMPIGLDDMGASAGSFFAGLTFSVGDATTAGSRTGSNGIALTTANLPAHSHSGTTSADGSHNHTGTTETESASHTHSGTTNDDSAHTHTITDTGHFHSEEGFTPSGVQSGVGATGGIEESRNTNTVSTGISINSSGAHTHTFTSGNASATHTHSFTTSTQSNHSHTFTTDTVGSGTVFNNLPRSVLVTWFIKL